MKFARSIHISRAENGDYEIRWTPEFSETPVDVYAGQTPSTIDRSEPVASQAIQSATITSRGNNRCYFYLQTADGEGATVAERLIPLAGGTNFRDFGGYPAADERRIKWGKLYRSGYMSRLSGEDVSYLEELDIKACCDFRSEDEINKEQSLLPDGTEIVPLTITPGSFQGYWDLMASGKESPLGMPELMEKLNIDLAENQVDQYSEMLSRLCNQKEGAFLINCSAGKDRTGFGAALIMMALGTPREAIMHDYLLSHKYFSAKQEMTRMIAKYSSKAGWEVDPEVLLPMMEARKEYLAAALDHIEAHYGTPEEYLWKKFSISVETLQQLRNQFTES